MPLPLQDGLLNIKEWRQTNIDFFKEGKKYMKLSIEKEQSLSMMGIYSFISE